MIGAIAGGAWGVAGANSISGSWRTLTGVIALAITTAIVVAVIRVPSEAVSNSRFEGGLYGVTVAAEALAILGLPARGRAVVAPR